ncbi:N-ethylmaleimide reductase [Stackebrandtia albiflava]|uniref:N-ethylmaleimide reductase n=1 Tax=Stackebrandtia albiflava TaxID=406432 RepID=A0A562V279_9ACTN|nr:alkene reductase [Stackebrandtia albiflava]TWJ11996.1 N-ethylmaleimide reductase [Stackebrandtia albiflava]
MTDTHVSKAALEPVALGDMTLPNRLVMAPMTRARAADGGLVTALTAEYYAQRASAGLIITESVAVNRVGVGFVSIPGLHDPAQVAAWRTTTEAVHAAGGRIFAQLNHAGRIGHPSLHPAGAPLLAPSPVAYGETYTPQGMLENPEPREMTLADVEAAVTDFARAARNAVDAGFDGVQLQAGNGFLIHQFLSDNANLRTDAYGGTVTGRIRFAVEVTEAVAGAIGAHRVAVRLTPANPYNGVAEPAPERSYRELATALPRGLAFVEVSEAGTADHTDMIRRAWGGGFVVNPQAAPGDAPADPARGLTVLRDGRADAVTLAKPWLANPDLVARIAAGGPYNTPDFQTMYGGAGAAGYTDYPTREAAETSLAGAGS